MIKIIKNFFYPVVLVFQSVFQERKYRIYFAILIVALFLLYIILPVVLTPGNSLQFQLSLLRFKDYVLMIFLSFITSLFLTMQIYLLRQNQKKYLQTAAQSGVGVFSAILSGLLSIPVCASCIAALLGFLGTGSVFFVFQNRLYILIGSVVLILVGIYFSAKQILKVCEKCVV